MPGGTTNPTEGRKTTKENASTIRPVTSGETRRTGVTVAPVMSGDVRDAEGARTFLEKHLLLCPPGEPATNASLVTCLHQVSNDGGNGGNDD